LDIQSVNASISPERFQTYLDTMGGGFDKALALYEENSFLAESFYFPLQSIEVTLRNAFSALFVKKTNVPTWYHATIMVKGRRTDLLRAPQRAKVDEEIARLNTENGTKPSWTLKPCDVIASLSFGFWVSLSDSFYKDHLWTSTIGLHDAFPNFGRRPVRDEIFKRLDSLRRLRNRIAHHEPIFRRDLGLDFSNIVEAVNWINPTAAAWTRSKSKVLEKLDECQVAKEAKVKVDAAIQAEKVAAIRKKIQLPPKTS